LKAIVTAAAGLLALASPTPGSARQVRTTFSFVVTIDDRVWPYNDDATEDIPILLPANSPWHCVRRRLVLPSDGVARGGVECTSDGGKTNVTVSASCGLDDEEQHNTAILGGGGSDVTVAANCRTVAYEDPTRVAGPRDWLGF
jgi:hypothetical protein